MPHPQVWKIELCVAEATLIDFADALEPIAAAVSTFAVPKTDLWRIEAYVPCEPDHDRVLAAIALAARQAGVAEPEFVCLPLPDRDWVSETQRMARPITAGRYFVHPSHHDRPAPAGSWPIELDAGLAFGSGEHATTKGCLMALADLARRRRFTRPLDLGTGSGILAIAMARAWPGPVTASDIDPDAVGVARENARRNGVGARVALVAGAGLSARPLRLAAPYDLIVANILARPLRALARDVVRALAPSGTLILSGLLDSQESLVLSAYTQQRLALRRRYDLLGWRTLVLDRR